MTPTQLRLRLVDNGYTPLPITHPDVPVADAGKRPRITGWQSVNVTPAVIRSWERGLTGDDTNTGIRTGPVIAIDIDVFNTELATRCLNTIDGILPSTPLRRIGRDPKLLLAYRAVGKINKAITPKLVLPDQSTAQVEFLAYGQQFVAFGTHPITRQPYRWVGKSTPLDCSVSDLPEFTAEQVTSARDALFEVLRKAGGRTQREIDGKDDIQAVPKKKSRSATNNSYPPTTREDVESALKAVPNDSNWHTWVKVGAALWDALADEGEDLFFTWSEKSNKHHRETTKRKWSSFRKWSMTIDERTLFWMARQNGWRPAAKDTSDAT